MKIKNFKYYLPEPSTLLTIALMAGSIVASGAYYQHENISQVCVVNQNEQQGTIFVSEDGKVYSYFDIGEHILTVSRNDSYTYKTEEIEGYTIKAVEVNGWRDNNKITYVNTVPVVVESTSNKDGKYEFNAFGTVESTKTEEPTVKTK